MGRCQLSDVARETRLATPWCSRAHILRIIVGSVSFIFSTTTLSSCKVSSGSTGSLIHKFNNISQRRVEPTATTSAVLLNSRRNFGAFDCRFLGMSSQPTMPSSLADKPSGDCRIEAENRVKSTSVNAMPRMVTKTDETIENPGEGQPFKDCDTDEDELVPQNGMNEVPGRSNTLDPNRDADPRDNTATLSNNVPSTTIDADIPSSIEITNETEQQRKFRDFREEFVKSLPKDHVAQWGQLAYGKFGPGKQFYPILILNPFQTPPDPIRSQWFQLYKKVRRR